MEQVWIGVGSNLLNPKKQVDCAIQALSRLPYTRLVSSSSYYRSFPLGMENQPDFLNAVVVLDTNLDPEMLLFYTQKIELQQGRIRTFTHRWSSRTLDLDILLFGQRLIHTDQLIVPHYDMKNRAFVMYPLVELDNTLVFPDGKKIIDVLKDVSDTGLNFW